MECSEDGECAEIWWGRRERKRPREMHAHAHAHAARKSEGEKSFRVKPETETETETEAEAVRVLWVILPGGMRAGDSFYTTDAVNKLIRDGEDWCAFHNPGIVNQVKTHPPALMDEVHTVVDKKKKSALYCIECIVPLLTLVLFSSFLSYFSYFSSSFSCFMFHVSCFMFHSEIHCRLFKAMPRKLRVRTHSSDGVFRRWHAVDWCVQVCG